MEGVCLVLATVTCLQRSELHHPMARCRSVSTHFARRSNWRPVSFSVGSNIELFLKNDSFPFSLCFLFGVLEFSFGYWSSRTYPPIDITFFGFHSILQDENPPSTISSSSSICFHCSYTFLFPGDFLLLLLSEFLVTSYLCVRNVIFSPNSEHFVDFFKFTMSYISNVYSKHVHMFCLLFAICLFF